MLAKLEGLFAPVFEDCGVELYDMEYVKEGGSRILRIFIDKNGGVDGGVDLNDCERVSRAVSDVLDEHDPIPDAYRLQVGSPGIDRRLSKPEHFERSIGEKITLKLFAPHSPVDGRKKFTGILNSYDGDKIALTDTEGENFEFSAKQIAACNIQGAPL
ncbi:MAG: ribosome maturation factor RimP [Defluviitaleaceae bacterium]|nr:ribosome maturation factor RimP [Defluviitaleaceae bacterium]